MQYSSWLSVQLQRSNAPHAADHEEPLHVRTKAEKQKPTD
jgi:hypothetical protein